MNIEQAYKIYVASLDVLEPQLGEELAFAIDRIIDHQANRAEQAEDKLDRVELAEVKARMEVERLREALTNVKGLWRYGTSEEIYNNLPRIAQMILDGEEGEWIK